MFALCEGHFVPGFMYRLSLQSKDMQIGCSLICCLCNRQVTSPGCSLPLCECQLEVAETTPKTPRIYSIKNNTCTYLITKTFQLVIFLTNNIIYLRCNNQ